jgi:hypothetical protein
MGDKAYVRLIDAHAKCNGRYNDETIIMKKLSLTFCPGVRV